jgi:hypothetical protein
MEWEYWSEGVMVGWQAIFDSDVCDIFALS